MNEVQPEFDGMPKLTKAAVEARINDLRSQRTYHRDQIRLISKEINQLHSEWWHSSDAGL